MPECWEPPRYEHGEMVDPASVRVVVMNDASSPDWPREVPAPEDQCTTMTTTSIDYVEQTPGYDMPVCGQPGATVGDSHRKSAELFYGQYGTTPAVSTPPPVAVPAPCPPGYSRNNDQGVCAQDRHDPIAGLPTQTEEQAAEQRRQDECLEAFRRGDASIPQTRNCLDGMSNPPGPTRDPRYWNPPPTAPVPSPDQEQLPD